MCFPTTTTSVLCMDTRPPRLAVFDIDGTLINARHPLGEHQIAALRGLYAAGIEVALASSRQRPSLLDLATAIGIPLHLIAYNGTLITAPDGAVLDAAEVGLPPALGQALSAYVAAGGCVHVYTRDDWLAFGADARIDNEAAGHGVVPGRRSATLDPAELPARVLKLMCDGTIDALDSVRAAVAAHPELVMSWSGTECHDVHARHATKGDALLKLCAALDVSPADSAAFGDADSDITMLENAGQGFAMGPASARVRQAADHHLDAPGSGALEALLAQWALRGAVDKPGSNTATAGD